MPEASVPAPTSRRAYPEELQQLELAALRQRRAALGSPMPSGREFPPDAVGIAVSGGGIRSATFGLGVFQALAGKRLLGAVDFLSTVSGGGYLGGFWGAWINRLRPGGGGSAGGDKTFAEAQRSLANSFSTEVSWLRENGRYLTPAGATDAWIDAAVYQRSLSAIHLVLGLAMFAGLCLVAGLRWLLVKKALWAGWSFTASVWTVHLSPLLGFVPVYLLLIAVYGAMYWRRSVRSSPERSREITDKLADLLKFLSLLAAVAVVDSSGLTLFETVKAHWHNPWTIATALAAAIGAVLALTTKAKGFFETLGMSGESRTGGGSIGSGLLAKIALSVGAVLLAFVWLTLLGFLASGVLAAVYWTLGHIDWFLHGWGVQARLWITVLAPGLLIGVLAGAIGRHVWFVNLSSLSSLYSSRLTRAYLGASNPHRQDSSGARRDSNVIADDQVGFLNYFPHEAGGPLHIVNVTVNQTVDAVSNIVQFDRKGMNMAVGPAGISVAVRHHARWVREGGETGPRTGQIEALDVPPGQFHVFCQGDAAPAPYAVETLPLGHWVGVSGAAFTTGLGSRTNRALSFLLCFFNVRLGWWWNSDLDTAGRLCERKRGSFGNCMRAIGRRVFRAQALLFAEMNARFAGTARRYWYLSDGGHFENTGAYELIRRRLPFIVVCDDGCDPQRTFDDFADLTRKARLDFDAEITTFTADEIATRVPAPLHEHIGTIEELERIDPATGFTSKCALLAWVHYCDRKTPDSLLLLIKPTVTGREPVDLLNYHTQHGDFPQQTTMDQFFDEAQWESYRLLGQYIASGLFEHAVPGQPLRQAFLK